MLDHNVFEVLWLSEVKSFALQDMKRRAVEARFVAQKVAYEDRDLQAPRHLRLLAHCRRWQPAGTRKKPGTSDVRHHSSVRALTKDEFSVLIPPAGLSSDLWTRSKVFPKTLYRQPCSHEHVSQ